LYPFGGLFFPFRSLSKRTSGFPGRFLVVWKPPFFRALFLRERWILGVLPPGRRKPSFRGGPIGRCPLLFRQSALCRGFPGSLRQTQPGFAPSRGFPALGPRKSAIFRADRVRPPLARKFGHDSFQLRSSFRGISACDDSFFPLGPPGAGSRRSSAGFRSPRKGENPGLPEHSL